MINKRSYKIVILFLIFINTLNFKVSALGNKDKNINFKRITVEDGLSQTTIEYMFQDSRGNVWIGTDDGLNKYNGDKFEVYRYDPENKNSISANCVVAITEDEYGDIWVGTSIGINKINTKTKEIKSYLSGVSGCNLSNNSISEILIDSKKDMYVATADGLNKYNKETDNFERLFYSEDEEKTLTNQAVYSIAEDAFGDLWIGTEDGLNKIIRSNDKIIKYYPDGTDKSISGNFIYKLFADDKGSLWIGTNGDGLNKLNINTGDIEIYKNKKEDNNSISEDTILGIIEDSRGIVWIATNKGLNRFDETDKKFISYESKIYDLKSIVNNYTISLMEDSSGAIWVGTYDGISIFNPVSKFRNYKKDPFSSNSITDNMISGIYEDDDGMLWVGTVSDGLNLIDRETGKINNYKKSPNENSISDNEIKQIVGIDDEIWIATSNGLNKYDKKTKKFTNYYNVPSKDNSLINNSIKSLYIDNENNLLIGTENGLCIFDRKDSFKSYNQILESSGVYVKTFNNIVQDKDGLFWIACGFDEGIISIDNKAEMAKHYVKNDDNNGSLSFNSVKAIAVDSKNNVWIGTQYGLNKFDRETEKFTIYKESDGLSNNFISGILFDENDNLWISTNYGISNFDTEKKKFSNFDVNDGIQGNEFNGLAYFKSKSGEMFFGGINGLTSFNPENIEENTFRGSVSVDSIYNINDEILDYDNIKLSYKKNQIQFKFFYPYYINTRKVQYAYKLDGIDENWTFSKDRNYANYTNLDSGKYKFKVIAKVSNGDWSTPKIIEFEVGEKPWKTPAAYCLYILLILAIIYHELNIIKSLDKKVEQRTHELNLSNNVLNQKLLENKELYETLIKNEKYKNNYFVNLSHELRTPLNVILAVQQLISRLNENEVIIEKGKIDDYMLSVKRNANRLLNLINNIIDTSKIESNAYKLNIKEIDIVYLVEEVALSMKEYIESKGIELIIDPEIEEKIIECDDNEIEKCIINLIANAVKFTPMGGKIQIEISDLGQMIKISVEDTGIGIEKKYHKTIFDRFGQAYNYISEANGGSGLGLTLTKQLISLHGGSITVKSQVGKGSRFIIILPVKQGRKLR
ncbi:sensor histidine kinase [Clostridium sp.]|uniref:sensor histidine kinase n=1 Tax=Clostridium sp. TaxID=1506 RepID=UPI00261F5075|nr:sensor histidine kinase [Clostridium sp.]